ncbi:hypothetical protein [Flavobacterium sp. GT3R68]|uniref:hypothetical protein n=1 Tax=Flavobacterium sp. GT3R68 TaxID=2594437 RepID=UPI000F88AE8A|nr:hypothetical protein [Flavobacterium sp. GT3R68]RTY89821.1 hypothetical protein EKL32_21955 [Flavobacterium sp. GSN2]TRW89800.1 hypothetical protein FNW07_12185 [Flavobacterium sp. GT3R68]
MPEIKSTATKPDRNKENNNDLVFSYMTMRNLIGFSGMLLPFVLALTTSKTFSDKIIEPSISDYYYTSNGDVLVVMLSMLSVFLFTYKGYEWKEKMWTVIAAICGIGIAFSPTVTKYSRSSFSVHTAHEKVPLILGLERHLLFAVTFFITLSIISLVYFPKSNKKYLVDSKGNRTQKAKRNIVFKVCGWTMIGCVLILGIYFLCTPVHEIAGDFPVIFVFEAIAIEAFGISWITKGETLWPDGEHYISKGFKIAKALI